MFVCDLTKVAEVRNEAGETRAHCNSNVALELGYAVRVLGWNRIIIVFNEAYGVMSRDLHFDARDHRASPYRCQAELDDKRKPTAACQAQISNAAGHLRTMLLEGLKLIAKDNPKRPHELEEKSPAEIRRQRDVEQLSRLLDWIHLGVIDSFLDRLEYARLTIAGERSQEVISELVKSVSFHINDEELRRRIESFVGAWEACATYSHSMDLHPGGQEAYFRLPGDIFVSQEQEKEFKFTATQAGPLREAFTSLLEYVRASYVEIDLSTVGKKALTLTPESR